MCVCMFIILNNMKLPFGVSKTATYRQFYMVKFMYTGWTKDALYVTAFPYKGKKDSVSLRILRILSHIQ